VFNKEQSWFILVCCIVSLGRLKSTVSSNAKMGLIRMLVVASILFLSMLFQLCIFFLHYSRFAIGRYYFPEWFLLGLVHTFAHLVESICILIILMLGSKQFVRKIMQSDSMGEKLLAYEMSEAIPKRYEI